MATRRICTKPMTNFWVTSRIHLVIVSATFLISKCTKIYRLEHHIKKNFCTQSPRSSCWRRAPNPLCPDPTRYHLGNAPTLSQPCIPPGHQSLNRVPALIGWRTVGNIASAEWQITQCDPMWHVSSRSGEAGCKLLYSVYLLKKHLKNVGPIRNC